MEYWPDSLVTTERVFSMSAELEASTVTPGMTAPEESRTVPTIEAWAWAMAGMTTSATRTRIAFTNLSIVTSKVMTAARAMFSGTELTAWAVLPPALGRLRCNALYHPGTFVNAVFEICRNFAGIMSRVFDAEPTIMKGMRFLGSATFEFFEPINDHVVVRRR